MTTFRPFRNGDPPALVRLWNGCELGRGAVDDLSVDLLDHLLLAQRHFDSRRLLIAEERGVVVGAALSGFGPNANGSGVDRARGVIAGLLVRPDRRRRGIGSELLRRSVADLREAGAESVAAGPAPPLDPFLVGLYGGSEPAGFLDSDAAAGPFFRACGFRPVRRVAVLQRDAAEGGRAGFQVLAARRKSLLRVREGADEPTWWWGTRYGRLDTLRFELAPKTAYRAAPLPPTAAVTLIGLDLYGARWGVRAVGLRDLHVAPGGSPAHAQALLLDVCRKLREEAVDLIEIHADEADADRLNLLHRAGFERVDGGTVYAADGA